MNGMAASFDDLAWTTEYRGWRMEQPLLDWFFLKCLCIPFVFPKVSYSLLSLSFSSSSSSFPLSAFGGAAGEGHGSVGGKLETLFFFLFFCAAYVIGFFLGCSWVLEGNKTHLFTVRFTTKQARVRYGALRASVDLAWEVHVNNHHYYRRYI
ncbi:hypothetical protein V8C26DRAFT_387044 [Trichoderma gracile]